LKRVSTLSVESIKRIGVSIIDSPSEAVYFIDVGKKRRHQ